MPEDENLIPEAAEIQEQPTISFSPVTNTEEPIVVPETAPVTVEPKIETPAPVETPEEDYDVVDLDENIAWDFLKKTKGLEVNNLDELLTPKEQKKYAPEMEKFNEFIEKTGNKDFNAFLETQKDWSQESEETVLKTYLKLSNPDLNERQIDHLYNKNYNIDGLDEEDDENEIFDKQINVKTDLRKANEFLEARKQEFSSAGGSDDYIPNEYKEAKKFYDDHLKQEELFNTERTATRNDFISQTENLFNRDFEGFKVKLGDEEVGFEEVSIKPENINEVKEFQLDSNNLIRDFLDEETGAIKDVKGYHEAMYMAKNYKSELNKAYMRGVAKALENQDKISKNVQLDNMRQVPTSGATGITFTIEK